VRDQYIIEIADRCHLDVARLRELMVGEQRTLARRPTEQPDTRSPERTTPEDEAVRLAIHRPDDVLHRLAPSLFGDPLRREAFAALTEHPGVGAAADGAGPEAASLLRRLAVESSDAEIDDVLAGLARGTADWVLRDLQRSARNASADADREGYAAAISWLKTQTELLAERPTRDAAIDQLLPWLIKHADGRAR